MSVATSMNALTMSQLYSDIRVDDVCTGKKHCILWKKEKSYSATSCSEKEHIRRAPEKPNSPECH